MGIPEESLEKLIILKREIDRIFYDFFDPQRQSRQNESGPLEVVLDVYETDQQIVMEAEMSGVDKNQIQLSVLRDIIVLEGAKARRHPDPDIKYHCMERSYGEFRRILEIPGAGDTGQIEAEFEQGILRIRLPKIMDRRGHRRKLAIR